MAGEAKRVVAPDLIRNWSHCSSRYETSPSAQIASAQADVEKARIDLQRREELASSGAVSGDELTSARNAFNTAAASLRSAQATRAQAAATRNAAVGDRNANRALIANSTVDNNPEVLAARAALAQARVDLERTVLRAPIDGVVSRGQVRSASESSRAPC